jgi:hypothetical protein
MTSKVIKRSLIELFSPTHYAGHVTMPVAVLRVTMTFDSLIISFLTTISVYAYSRSDTLNARKVLNA